MVMLQQGLRDSVYASKAFLSTFAHAYVTELDCKD